MASKAANKSKLNRGIIALATAWLITLLVLAGGALFLQSNYQPPESDVASSAEPDLADTDGPSSDDPAPSQTTERQTAQADQQVDEVDDTGATAAAAAKDPETAAPFPDPALLDDVTGQSLPVVSGTGLRPLDRYAHPVASSDLPAVVVVLTHLGLSKTLSDRALANLPRGITLAISPYADDAQDWATRAHEAGHELMLMLPTEPQDYPRNDPGPHTLLVELPSAKNIERLHYVMSRFGGYVGVINHMGSRFTADRDALRPVLEDLGRRGLLLLDSRSSRFSAAGLMAKELQVPVAINNSFIDTTARPGAIDDKLNDLETFAKAVGYAVGVGQPFPVTVERLQEWSKGLASRGVRLVPISAIADKQTIR